MKNLLKIAFIATIICTNFAHCAESNDDKVLATYDGGEVKESQVAEQFKAFFEMNHEIKDKKISQLPANIQDRLVRGFVNVKLLDIQAQTLKIETSKEFIEKMNMFKKQLAQNELVSKVVGEKVTSQLVEEECKKIEAELKNQKEVKIKHILVESEKTALSIKQRIVKGEKFADLAKKLSADESSKAKGGELVGYHKEDQLPQEFKAVFSMKKGEISAPVKTQFGWHIVQLDDIRAVKLPAKEELMSIAKSKLDNAAIEKYLEDLNATFNVKILVDTKPQPVTEEVKK